MIDYAQQSDESLMVLLSQQDHQAFTALVHRHTQRFYACAYRYCADQDEAEDVVQDCFLKIWAKPSLWKEGKGAKFTTWFYRIVSNAAIDKVRARKNHKGDDILDVMADSAALADTVLSEKECAAQLEAAIQSLPERQKSALNLCIYEELTNKEAAQVMGIGVKALESLLMRAKSALRDRFIRQGISPANKEGEAKYG